MSIYTDTRKVIKSLMFTKVNDFFNTDDGEFSIDTRLEPLGAVGPICWVGSPYNLQPAL